MKYSAVAATLVGAAIADSAVWDPVVKPTTTTTKKVDPATWDPVVKPTTTTTPYVWEPVKVTTTTSKCAYVTEVPVTKYSDDKKKSWVEKTKTTLYADKCTWADWEQHQPTPVAPTDKCAYVTVVPVTKYSDDKSKYWIEKTKTTLYADKCTWADWEKHQPAPTTSSKCSYVTEVPVTYYDAKNKDKSWVDKTKTTYYADVCTWANYDEVVKAETETQYVWEPVKTPAVVTSVVKADWSDKDGWFGPAWPTAKDGCAVNVVTSYGAPIWKPVPEASATTWAPVVDPSKATTWAPVAESSKATTWAPVVDPSKATTWAPVAESSTATTWSAVETGKGHAIIKPNGDKWAMTYSPYTDAGKCKSEDAIKADIKKLAGLGFTSVRVYGTKCDTLKFVGNACRENKLKLILGVFIDKTGINGAKDQVAEIKKWAQWDIVELIVIGNEAVFQGFCKEDELVAFIKSSKWEFQEAGYTGGCTTTEPLNIWQKSGSKFCEVVDVVSANLYAYFNKDCPAENAGEFIKAQVDILTLICKNKDTYVMESGWPSEGQCNGKACPSKDNQAVAIKKIKEVVGAKIVFFSFEDELWKAPGQFGVEQHWGCADVFSSEWDPVKVTKTTTTVKPTATNWTNQ